MINENDIKTIATQVDITMRHKKQEARDQIATMRQRLVRAEQLLEANAFLQVEHCFTSDAVKLDKIVVELQTTTTMYDAIDWLQDRL